MSEQLAKDIRAEDIRNIEVEFDTYAEKQAFQKGLTFEEDNDLQVISIEGHYDNKLNDNGKYEWSLGTYPT
jgi:hypothetical protein